MTPDRGGSILTPSGQLKAEDGTLFAVNDHAYFVCEPPGEPYYLARIMQFLHVNGNRSGPVESVRVNWYYRPKDIQRKVQDTRVVFATMHSDTCPLASLRGKCRIQHISEIPNLDQYRVRKDSFWFDKLFDRYIHRYYEVIPTNKVINVPQHVKKVLDERWKFVLVEIGRGKDLTSAVKACKKCGGYAANTDSVDCAVCKNTYHMACVRPVLTKKPARGFAWACAACSRAQERKLEARHTPIIGENSAEVDEEIPEEEEDDAAAAARRQGTRASSPTLRDGDRPPATGEQIAQAVLWPYRYLGVHSKPEDALDYDDRIYPRASSRLGPRHQANVAIWHGRPVELVKPADIRKKYVKPPSHKKDAPKPYKEPSALFEADGDNKMRRPKWVMDEPLGYIARGKDTPVEIKGKKEKQLTAHVIFKMPSESMFTDRGEDDNGAPMTSLAAREALVDEYMVRVKPIASEYGLKGYSTNFLTKALERLYDNNHDVEAALLAMKSLHIRNDLKEPDLSKEEIKRFEEGVSKYGSELHTVTRHVGGGVKHSRIVRFYYMWKKGDRGRQIWGNYEGRKSKKESKKLDEAKHKDGNVSKLVDDVADDHDDSAFDTAKADRKKRGFICKFCSTKTSRQWRRAPGTAPGTLVAADSFSKGSKDKGHSLTLALCGRCAYLWRRYAIQFESIEEVSKKIAAAGGRASKRRIDEELMRAIVEAQQESGDTISSSTAAVAASAGVEVPSTIIRVSEPPRKKAKIDKDASAYTPEAVPERKKAAPEKPLEPVALRPEPPRVKVLPCAVCGIIDLPGDDYLSCRDCRLAVHKSCYGVHRDRNPKKWYCDMCSNDRNPMVSTMYVCVLCPVKQTGHELMEPPKVSHKKKTDRERDKERKEKEMVEEAVRLYRQQQEAAGRPPNPREPLKRTAWNNWVHVTCALWTPEIKFGHSELLEPAEGVGFIPVDRYKPVCKFCKSSGQYPVVACHASTCNAQFHVGCAHLAGYIFCFDITPVKGSRRDTVTTVKLGEETGSAAATIWCPQHAAQPSQHSMVEATDEGLTALQVFARNFKQVDESMTGTVRRAAQFTSQHHSTVAHPTTPLTARRASTVNGVKLDQVREHERTIATRNYGESPEDGAPRSAVETPTAASDFFPASGLKVTKDEHAKCFTCSTTFSPKWWQMCRLANAGKKAIEVNGSRSALGNGSKLETDHHHHLLSSADPPSPEQSRSRGHSQVSRAQLNGVIKTEPTNSDLDGGVEIGVLDEPLVQCHKCHLLRRSTPPLSPTADDTIKVAQFPLPASPPVVPQAAMSQVVPDLAPLSAAPSDIAARPEHVWSGSMTAPQRSWPPVPEPMESPVRKLTFAAIDAVATPPSASQPSLPPLPPPTPPQQHLRSQPNGSLNGSPSYMHGPPAPAPPPPLPPPPPPLPPAAAAPSSGPAVNGHAHANAPRLTQTSLPPPLPAPIHSHSIHNSLPPRSSLPPPQFSPPVYPRPTNAHLFSTSPSPPSSHIDPRLPAPQQSMIAAPVPTPTPYPGHYRQQHHQHHQHHHQHHHHHTAPDRPFDPHNLLGQNHSHSGSRPRGHSFDGYPYASLPPPPSHNPPGLGNGSNNINNSMAMGRDPRFDPPREMEWEREREREREKERERERDRQRPLPGAASASPSVRNLLS